MGTEADREGQRDPDGFGSEPRVVLDETTPADRAGWEEALGDECREPGDVAGSEATAPPTAVPEYEEDHPAGPPVGPDEIGIADLRPEVEGETPAERARRSGTGG